MDRLEAMSMLVTVTEAGSLTAAARALKVPLATLSRKVAELERLVGARLLIRTTRKLTLTDAGAGYVVAARRILEQVEDAEREASGELDAPKGELVITAPVMFGRLHVLPVVAEFLALYPEINVRLLLADRLFDLVDAHVDMAVRIGKLADSSNVATQVGTIRSVIVASPALLEAHGVPKKLVDVKKLPTIAVDGSLPSLDGIRRLSVTTTDAAVDAAVRGVGLVRLLHYQVASAVAAGALRIVLEKFEAEPLPVHLVHQSRGQMPQKMRRFIDFAAPKLRASGDARHIRRASSAPLPR
ncbi:MAG TPA: LysR family transcriptional regulator [Kofleriaceae bacterium]|jgi:DNA-binding transcriptional LysR family regulator